MKKLLAVLLVLTMLVSSVAMVAQADEPEQVLHLKMGNNATGAPVFQGLFPWNDADLITHLYWLPLIWADKNLDAAKPAIMKSWDVQDEGTTIVLELQEGLQWSDGEPITMEDVVWTIERWAKVPSNYWAYTTNALKYVKGFNEVHEGTADTIEGIEYTDTTLTFHLTAPFAQFVNLLCQLAPLPKHVYENCDFDDFRNDPIWNEVPVGSGMFTVSEYEPNSYVIYGLNPYYKGETPKITKVITSVGGDYDVLARNGEVDFFSTNEADLITMMKDIPGYTATTIPILYFRHLYFNFFDSESNPKSFVSDVRVRKAIAMAIDWDSMIDAMYGDMASTTQTGVLSSDVNYIGDWHTYDPEAAKALLDEANYDYEHTLKILYYYNDPVTIDIMDAVVYYLKQIGMDAEAVYTADPVGDFYERRIQDLGYAGLSAYDATSWYGQYTRDNMDKLLGSKDRYQDAVKELETAFTPEKWSEAITKLQNMEIEDIFFIPVYTLNYIAYNKDSLSIPEDCLGNLWYFFDLQFPAWEIVG